MNDPNNPPQSGQSSAPQKMSSRATNFLMMGSGAPKTGAEIAAEQAQDVESANQQQPVTHDHSAQHVPTEQPQAPPQKQTGVVSSTIMPAQRPGNTAPEPQQSAPRTQNLGTETGKEAKKTANLSPEEKQKLKEEKVDKLAERITDVLKKLNDFKTGMLDKDIRAHQKIQLMAENSPAMSKLLGIMLHQLEPLLFLMQRINQKLVEKNLVQRPPKPAASAATDEARENQPPPPPEKVSFVELAEKNIIFCDNRKRPLYTLEQMRGKHGYTASEEVLSPMILENILKAFHEVAPKAKAIPTPSSGIYANIPMDQVMDGISEEDVMRFLNYVQRFPRGYVGKNFRITESFAGWVVSGTPDD